MEGSLRNGTLAAAEKPGEISSLVNHLPLLSCVPAKLVSPRSFYCVPAKILSPRRFYCPLLTLRVMWDHVADWPSLTLRVVIVEVMTVGGNNLSMPDPVAYFITWPTYGTWLPGDERGWVEYRHGWQLPDPELERYCLACMTERQCLLSVRERKIVLQQILETCQFRRWVHFASDCRSNHAHIVIGAVNTPPKKIRVDIKAWCTRRLREQSRPEQENWWAERGSIRYVWTEDSLSRVNEYVSQAQDRMGSDAMEWISQPEA